MKKYCPNVSCGGAQVESSMHAHPDGPMTVIDLPCEMDNVKYL